MFFNFIFFKKIDFEVLQDNFNSTIQDNFIEIFKFKI